MKTGNRQFTITNKYQARKFFNAIENPQKQPKFTIIGDEHPLNETGDLASRGANYILEQDLIKKDTCLVLEFLRKDFFYDGKNSQKILNDYLLSTKTGNDLLTSEEQNNLQTILYNANSLRGYKECKNISFFALIKRAKEVGAKVLCGDSNEAINKKDRKGATEERHPAMNEAMTKNIKNYSKTNQAISNYIILCGDSHLFNKKLSTGEKSSSLAELLNQAFTQSIISVIVQEAVLDKNKEFLQKENLTESSIKTISYKYLPQHKILNGFNNDFQPKKIVTTSDLSNQNSGARSGSQELSDFHNLDFSSQKEQSDQGEIVIEKPVNLKEIPDEELIKELQKRGNVIFDKFLDKNAVVETLNDALQLNTDITNKDLRQKLFKIFDLESGINIADSVNIKPNHIKSMIKMVNEQEKSEKITVSSLNKIINDSLVLNIKNQQQIYQ